MSYYNTTSGGGGDYGGNSFASLLANAAQNKQQQFDTSSPSVMGSVQVQQSPRYSPNSAFMSLPSSTSSSGYQSQAGFSSPESSLSSLYTTSRARFMCSKGFELEDDIEFCPKIVDLETLGASHDTANNSTHSLRKSPILLRIARLIEHIVLPKSGPLRKPLLQTLAHQELENLWRLWILILE
ncbi:hypothetical protein HII13_005162 [Brettanomyces bruxellensis]|nr:hypothetical protein HII13_005162 [Brettanomyces bruxellensis]